MWISVDQVVQCLTTSFRAVPTCGPYRPPQSEPALLVGETGTGKTTLLSRVAALTGHKLVAFNMSQQTDSSDLLGGFKPVDVRDALLPLLPAFLSLIRKTYTK